MVLYERNQFKFRAITTWKFKESSYNEILQLTLKSTSVELQIIQSYISINHELAILCIEQENSRFQHSNKLDS